MSRHKIAKVSKSPKTNSERSTATSLHTNIPCPASDGQQAIILSTEYIHHCVSTDRQLFLPPPRSAYKTLFLGTRLGEILRAMSFTKSVPKGLKLWECKWDVGGKNSPIHYIPMKNPVQEALMKNKRPTTSS
jgi:hypothetical protein